MNKPLMTRAIKRELNEERIPIIDLLKIKKHFFKNLDKSLSEVSDPRHESYTKYRTLELLMTPLLGNLMTIKTVSGVTESFNTNECIDNFRKIVKNPKLVEIPHHDTITDFLKEVNSDEIIKVRTDMIKDLLIKRSFERYRFENEKGKHWLVAVDGTGTHSFNKRHCEHCLTRKHVDKETGKETFSYYHNVLEAKLILGEFVFSIGTEFIENEDEFVSKQDCERNAFKRLAKRLKKDSSRLPICILADSLYANGPVMDICKENRWEYVIRFKSGSMKNLNAEFENISKLESNCLIKEDHKKKVYQRYIYVNDLEHKENSLSVAELEESTVEMKDDKEVIKVVKFKYISSIKVSKKNVIEIIKTGRKRWKIENEGFNVQKNHGYEIHHLKSTNVNAMKNHYLLIQIAHIIRQIYFKGIKVLKNLKLSIKKESQYLLSSFQRQLADKDFIKIETCRIQVRFL